MITEEKLNSVYKERALAVVKMAQLALQLGYVVTRREPSSCGKEWGVLYVELPEGQVSWHFSEEDSYMITQFPVDNSAKWDGRFNGRDVEFMTGEYYAKI